MFKMLRKMKGKSTLEYAVLIIIIIGALLTIQVYIKRGIQGRLKSSADDIGDQYSPGNTNVSHKTITNSVTNETFKAGVTESKIVSDNTTTNSNMNILITNQEFWGTGN